MKKTKYPSIRTGIASLACCFGLIAGASASTLIEFPFNEGSGVTVQDTAQGLSGYFGTAANIFDPSVDTVSLVDDSPTGQAGDRSFANTGKGFLIGDTGTDEFLNITNGPITLESWVKIDGSVIPGANEGVVSYGSSYKLGFKSGVLVFTLWGKADITNSFMPILPLDEWFHVASAWEPGVGVHFHVTTDSGGGNYVTTSTLVENTNTTARVPLNTYLSVGNEGTANPLVGRFDRVRIHNALLTANELDSNPTTPKASYPSTKVVYNFNESNFPALNSLSPSLPLDYGNEIAAAAFGPVWTTDSPSGQPGDYALAFNMDGSPNLQRINVDYAAGTIDLGANNTNYTLQAWVKLPSVLPTTRMVMFRTSGVGPRVSFSITANRTLHTTIYGVQDLASSVVVPDDGEWHHVAVVMTNYAQARFYLDGVLRQTLNRTDTRNASTSGANNFQIGTESTVTTVFRGMLDRIRVSNTALTGAELDAAKVPGAPFISVQPVDVAVAGGNASFSVTAGGDSLSYQWYFAPANNPNNKSIIPGGTSATLNLSNPQPSQNGYYSVVVSNGSGSVESSQATLTVLTVVISEQPTNITTVVGAEATFSVTASPAPGFGALSYQWQYAPPANPENKTNIPGANSSTLTLSNLELTQQGFYSVLISNNEGSLESSSARLIATVPGTLQPLWSIKPTDGRSYITGHNTDANLRDLERGMGYNPVTDHLLIGARFTSPLVKGIFIVDAATGAHVGELPSVTDIVNGGTIVLTRVVVADDGAIYACNFGTLSDANPFKIYRWANESATPTVAYEGNPVSGTGLANQQWGKNMTVRGSGANTQILVDTRNKYLGLFTTTDGVNFTPTILEADANANDDWNIGLVWGADGTVWGKANGRPLYQWQIALPSTNAPLLRTFSGSGFPSALFQNFSFSEDHRYMAGTFVQAGADAVELYDISDLNRGPLLVDSALFEVDNAQTVNQGNVFIRNNRVIALNPNNGIVAFALPASSPTVGARRTGNDLTIFWSSSFADYVLEASDSLTSTVWSTVPHTTVGNENQATISTTGASKFYRLKK